MVSVFNRFPADVLLRYSGLARAQLPLSQTEWTRKGPVAVMTLPSSVASADSLRYVLQFLRKLPEGIYGSPQIRSPGMFSFTEAVSIYQTVLQLELPWEQHLLRNQLLDYMSEKPLMVGEVRLVWENIPRDDAIVTKMLEMYIMFVQGQRYSSAEKEKVKLYLKTRADLLAALDGAVDRLRSEWGASVSARKNVESHVGEEKRKRITQGLGPIDQEFLRWVKREGARPLVQQ
jgi:hypothetical protein